MMKSNEIRMRLQLFADFPNDATMTKTSTVSMAPTMKTFYDTSLLENARETMVFSQFAKKERAKGNKVEWRRYNKFQKATTPLTEGVIPSGQTFGMTKIEANVNQHGDYTTVTDRLKAEAFDDVIYGATEEMGAAMGETWDTLTRNAICTGNSVWYAGGKTSRSALTAADKLTPALVKKVSTWLKKNGVPKINGSYLCLIHPDVAEDLSESEDWKEVHKYSATKEIFKGELGELYGIRFIEANNAKIVKASDAEGAVSVFQTLFFGKDAYGEVDLEGEGCEMIIKTPEEIGGPLNQFSTIGYKFCHAAKILYQERIMRVESSSSYSDEAVN